MSVIISVVVAILFPAPLFIPASILIKYGKSDIGKYVAFLILKPVITYPIWILIFETSHKWLLNFEYPYPVQTILASSRTLPEMAITVIIAYRFRRLFSKNKLTWFLLIFDLIRWLTVFVATLITTLPYTENILIFMVLFFPGLYAISGLVGINIWPNNNTQPTEHKTLSEADALSEKSS